MRIAAILNRKNAIVLLAAVITLGGGYFLWHKFLCKPAPTEEEKEAATIEVVPIVSKVLFREDQLPGEINGYQDVLIYPKVPGFIKWLGVDRGSVIKKDDLIATMYAPEYIARRNEALAKVAAARAALAAEESRLEDYEADLRKRQANLLADQSTYQRVNAASLAPGVMADNDVIQWAQTVEVDRQDVNMMIKRVNAKAHEVALRRQEVEAKTHAYQDYATFSSYLEVRAPFNGYITERKLHVGSFVGPNGKGAYPPICRIKQLDLLRIVAPVPERDTAAVIAGSQVQFSVSCFPGRRFVGTVARVSNSLDKETRTMPVELNYFNPDYKILPGMFCKIYWPTRRQYSSMFVPLSAVTSTPLETFVCKVKNGIVEWVSVTQGQIMNGMIEIFSNNLHENDMVAKHASEELKNQSAVKISQDDQ
jgi:RND family efflux transporter MFP subunit